MGSSTFFKTVLSEDPISERNRELAQHKDAETAIASSLEKQKLKLWGFVIIRCTYGSQERWDYLIALLKLRAREYLVARGMLDLYEKWVCTVIEDPASDGADISETSKRFADWVWTGDGNQEREQGGRSVRAHNIPYSLRYTFYLHADEESLESVVDEKTAATWGGYCLKAVRAGIVIRRDLERRSRIALGKINEDEEEEEEDEYDMEELRKKVKVHEIVDLYSRLLDCNRWYNIYMAMVFV